jgi:hypothetical protein
VDPASSKPDDLTGIRINRLWSEGNHDLLRNKPAECRDVDELLHICIEMSKQKPQLVSARDSDDHQISTASADDRNDAACYYETSVENSTACWYRKHSNNEMKAVSSMRRDNIHFASMYKSFRILTTAPVVGDRVRTR